MPIAKPPLPWVAALGAGLALLVTAERLVAQSEDLEAEQTAQVEHTTLVYPPFAHTLGIHRARSVHLKLFLGDRTRFDDPQGVAAVKFNTDDDPETKGDDYQLTLFGVNSGRGEIIYNSTMQTLAVYGRRGEGEAMFTDPHGITATPDGRIYVADTGNQRVARLGWDAVGRSVRWVGEWAAGEPFDVDADARGQVYAADRQQNAVLRWADSIPSTEAETPPSTPIVGDRWPLPDDVSRPRSLAVGDSLDPWFNAKVYRLYLVDLDGARLGAYDATGRIVARVNLNDTQRPPGDGGGFAYVTLDYYGNVYVTDTGASVVHKFDGDLRSLAIFPGPGSPESAIDDPRGITIWRRFGQVFVAERDGAQYFFLGVDFEVASVPVVVHHTNEPEVYSLELKLTELADITLTFVGPVGDTLATAGPGRYGTGDQVVQWAEAHWIVSPKPGWETNATTLIIEARPTYSSRKRFSRTRRVSFVIERP